MNSIYNSCFLLFFIVHCSAFVFVVVVVCVVGLGFEIEL